MEYSKQQLDMIQKECIRCSGLENIGASIFLASWGTHAMLAGYNVEHGTGRLYKQKDNVRTYYQ